MNDIIAHITHSLHGLYEPEELRSLAMKICKEQLELSDMDIYLRKEIKLSGNKECLFKQTIARLKNHEPVQYVLGSAGFYGMIFEVAPDVLIPRPETEELVEHILKENAGQMNVLDIGTGSGCIAIALAKNLPQAVVEAWDVSAEALTIARNNAKNLNADVRFRLIDVFDVTPPEISFHIIVSNPPYITEKEKAVMDKNVLEWEPGLALFVPDNDPLRFYRRIAQLGRDMLTPDGKLYLEINQAYGPETVKLLETFGYKQVTLVKDIFDNNRIITAVR